MKISTFVPALCIAAGVLFAADAGAASFGPRAIGAIEASPVKVNAARIAVTHAAGPRGTIAIRKDVAPSARTASIAADSCVGGHRAGPRASMCL